MKCFIFRLFFLHLFLVLTIFTANAQKKPRAAEPVVSKASQSSDEKTNSKEQTLKNTSFSAMEAAVIDEINEARREPQKFVAYLEEYKKALKGNVLYLPDRKGIMMIEGAAAIDDAISDLKKLSKLELLSASDGLYKAAQLQLTDLKQDSTLSHKGKDGSDVESRLFRFGVPGTNIAENICYKVAVAREVVMTMILDDGLKSRPHRKNVFSSKFKKIGVSCGVSDKNDSICVTVFTDSFIARN